MRVPASEPLHEPAGDFRVVFNSLADCSLITSDELAMLLGLPASAIYKRRLSGDLPVPVSVGARILRWRVSDVREWLASRPLTSAKASPRREGASRAGRPRKLDHAPLTR